MKPLTRWLAFPAALVILGGTAGTVFSQVVSISGNSATVQLNGTSGGSKKSGSCAGNTAAAPNHVIQVTEDSNLQFTLQSSGEPALLIRGGGQDFCVPADSFSGGKISVPGRWPRGSYSVFVGDRAGGQHPYTLSISRN